MLTKENVLNLIYTSLEKINLGRAPGFRIALEPDTRLLGEGGVLNSLDVVDVIINLEEQLTLRLNRHVTLHDEQLLCQESSPLRDIATLAAFLEGKFL